MLTELDDVYRYTHRLGLNFPEIAAEVELRPLQEAPAGLKGLEAELHLPSSYIACASRIALLGVSLGYFALWPRFGTAKTIVASIRDANLADEPATRSARDAGLIIVGREEANLVCVGRSDSPASNIVHHLDVSASPRVRNTEIAPDFEKFILLAANVHQIGYEEDIEPREAVARIGIVCRQLGCGDAQTAFWRLKLSELLG